MKTSYEELLKAPQWKKKRGVILNRDNHKCRCCGSTNILQVHHRQYHITKKTGEKKDPWAYDNKYLITLCKACHEKGHKTYQIPQFNI